MSEIPEQLSLEEIEDDYMTTIKTTKLPSRLFDTDVRSDKNSMANS